MINWIWKEFDKLTVDELFDILKLRQQVFIVEQRCAYPDIDDLDKGAWHLLARGADGLVGYLRIISLVKEAPFIRIGRIVTDPSVRGQGIGKQLFAEGIHFVKKNYPQSSIKISAQVHLEKFYADFGFKKVSDPYDEDGIMHIDMHQTLKN